MDGQSNKREGKGLVVDIMKIANLFTWRHPAADLKHSAAHMLMQIASVVVCDTRFSKTHTPAHTARPA